MTLFREHLRVFDDDREIKIKYADTLLKVSRSLPAQSEAARIYLGIFRQSEGREDVRRWLMELKFDMGHIVSGGGGENGADVDLKILLEMPKNKMIPTFGISWGNAMRQEGMMQP